MKRLPSLDGLRAVAVAVVLLAHVLRVDDAPQARGAKSLTAIVLGNGQRGVEIFFVISGFIITYLFINEVKITGGIDLKKFYLRRMLRIFPAYYSYLLTIGLLALASVIVFPRMAWISAALYVYNYTFNHRSFWVDHLWSLSVEEQFYILWPTLLIVLGFTRARNLAIVLIAVLPVVRVVSYFAFPSMRMRLGDMGHTRFDTLMFGCLVAMFFDHPKFIAATNWCFKRGLPLLALLVVFVISPLLEARFHGMYMLSIGYSIDGISIVIFMVWLIRERGTLAFRALNAAPVIHVGTISYGLYMWQPLFLSPGGEFQFGHRVLGVVWTFAVAELSYWLLERRFIIFGTRFRPRPSGSFDAPAQAVAQSG